VRCRFAHTFLIFFFHEVARSVASAQPPQNALCPELLLLCAPDQSQGAFD